MTAARIKITGVVRLFGRMYYWEKDRRTSQLSLHPVPAYAQEVAHASEN